MTKQAKPSPLVNVIGIILAVLGVIVMVFGGSCAGMLLLIIPAMEHFKTSDLVFSVGYALGVGVAGYGLFWFGRWLRR